MNNDPISNKHSENLNTVNNIFNKANEIYSKQNFFGSEKILYDIAVLANKPDTFMDNFCSQYSLNYRLKLDTIIKDLKDVNPDSPEEKKFQPLASIGEDFLNIHNIIYNISIKNIDYIPFICNNFLGNSFDEQFKSFCKRFLYPYICGLEKMLRYNLNENKIAKEFFNIEEQEIAKEDVISIEQKTPDETFIESFLTEISNFTYYIKNDRKLKKQQKLLLGSIVENILYTHERFKDIISLYHSFTILIIACQKIKRYQIKLSELNAEIESYISNKPIVSETIDKSLGFYRL